MKKIILFFISTVVSCSTIPLERESVSPETLSVELYKNRISLIRSIHGDTYLEKITDQCWDHIIVQQYFINSEVKNNYYRVPPLLFFSFVFKNTISGPVTIKDISLSYKGKKIKALSADNLKKRYTSPAYRKINFENLTKMYRLLVKPVPCDKLAFDTDTVPYRFPYVSENDTVSRIIAFPWVPSHIKNYNITITYVSRRYTRTVTVPFQKMVYRKRGDYFKKPEKKEDFLD